MASEWLPADIPGLARLVELVDAQRRGDVSGVVLDFTDDEQIRAALAEAYGDAAEWMDLERLIAEARDPQTSESDFRRYFLNQATRRADSGSHQEPGPRLKPHERFLKG
jgi:hypothetical protein